MKRGDKEELDAKKQKVLDTINDMMDISYGCAESFVAAAGEYLWGGVDDQVQMISTGFSGGVGGTNEELCGGISGAVMLIGMLYGRTEPEEAKMVRCKRLVSKHRDRFIDYFGSSKCQELRDAQFGADERNPCSAIIAPAAYMLIEMLEEEESRIAKVEATAAARPKRALLPKDEYISLYQDADADTLLEEVARWELPHEYRLWLGERLNAMGDPRPGVGLRGDSLPDIAWLPVDGGEVEVERAGNFEVQPFYMAKYPLTHQQFQVFLDDPHGFGDDTWWKNLNVPPEQREAAGKQRFVQNNKPRDNVTWFDAVAFCRWMTARLRNLDEVGETGVFKDVLDKIKNEGWEVRLPTEWEWQMAATAAEPDNLFPWGLDWDDVRVHTKHNQLNQSMPVGMYLEGASPYGVLDMSGNVWEWCLNTYDDPGILRLESKDRRVLCGGSWYHWGSYAHTKMRLRYFPDYRWNAGGFRLVCAKSVGEL